MEKSDKIEYRRISDIRSEKRKGTNGKEKLIIEGVACTFDTETVIYKDSDCECREKITAKAFDDADMSNVIFNYNHNGRVYARSTNGTLTLEVKNDGLHIAAELNADDNGHRELYRDIQTGLIDKMSFAFTVGKSEYAYAQNKDGTVTELRTITKIDKVYDVSAVDIPTYDDTSISARNAFAAERERRRTEKETREKLKLKIKLEGI